VDIVVKRAHFALSFSFTSS